MRNSPIYIIIVFCLSFHSCSRNQDMPFIQTVNGIHKVDTSKVWLTHEHLLVDFIGADSISQEDWVDEEVLKVMLPHLSDLHTYKVNYFVDPTPNFLGRDPGLLQQFSEKSGIAIITNTGLYGAVNNKYIPEYAYQWSDDQLAESWINEFENGIGDTGIKPGFIKISVDNLASLEVIDAKLVKAAAKTHLKTGLTIASHTGAAKGLWPQLNILKDLNVTPSAFIWVHAQAEEDMAQYLKAADSGCWISFDGLGWEMKKHLEKLVFAKENGILDHVLISHDAGWYDPQKTEQNIVGYTRIFKELLPALEEQGFTQQDINMLLKINPAKAFGISVRSLAHPSDED
ncbi:phosphotriesterase [Echinicola sp. 20G]|uniref:phosphotriesterase family protein n=1 Tax=Echinicola sp. 20G TaxID=2781961 RepID=UPI00190FED0A|nr:phosphotriesterase [Echinicola sp. 20G]